MKNITHFLLPYRLSEFQSRAVNERSGRQNMLMESFKEYSTLRVHRNIQICLLALLVILLWFYILTNNIRKSVEYLTLPD